MHSRIFIIGFMGSGKTTHGKKIARMMDYRFIDMDQWIENREGMKIPQIFQDKGEKYFRSLEAETIEELGQMEKVVISTGGGAPCFGTNMVRMNELGLTVYLKLNAAALLQRLIHSRTERPLVAGKSEEEMMETIESLLTEREVYYNKALMIIDGLERVNERLVNAIQRQS